MLAATRTIAAARRALAEQFRQAGIDSAEADARLLLSHALGTDRAALIVNGERALSTDKIKAIDALVARRLEREPVSRILGSKEFWTLSLAVTPDVLVPRPETETVVEAALEAVLPLKLEKLRILDIGTGSGALLLALLSELPNASGIGTDISAAALDVARANAQRNALAARCSFAACDIATLAPEVRDYDPPLALDGGADGLDGYRAIARHVRPLLAPAGRLIVELGADQERAVHALFTNAGLNVAAAKGDLAGIPRALTATAAS
jgi:release factor glutamine methyltransferase